MANPFLNKTELMDRDIETALLLEKAIVFDIKSAVAYTDGEQIFINTDDNLFSLLPAYDHRMLKWLLWHEKMHLELKHHNRFFKYLEELDEARIRDEFQVTKAEVNIIMDILVHDSLSRMFPELVEVATTNLAQFRNRNSLSYTFKTFTLEEMLDEYRKYKHKDDEDGEPGDESEDDSKEDDTTEAPSETSTKDDKSEDESKDKSKDKSKDIEEPTKDTSGEGIDKKVEKSAHESDTTKEDSHHTETDWSKLKTIDTKEFISDEEAEYIKTKIEQLKKKKFRLIKLTETLNGLVTSTRKRTYTMPSTIHIGNGVLLKGSVPGKQLLYLIFDASGSMRGCMNTFKEIISKSIPQAMDTTCEWFAGDFIDRHHTVEPYKVERGDGYYKSKFKDFMNVDADDGYSDDGDRTIELCWLAEQAGYTPIGVTDGGGKISWSKDKLRQLKRTVLVGDSPEWLKLAKEINPNIQTLCLYDD